MVDYYQKRIEARKLRKQGKSHSEIGKLLKIAKSSSSLYCRGITLTGIQKRRLIDKNPGGKIGALANKIKRQKEVSEIKSKAAKEIIRLSPNDLRRLKDIGTVIYWAEGTKKNAVDITNSDPEMIKIAMLWFRYVCNVNEEKFKPSIFYHHGQDEYSIKRYWSEITRIPMDQFHKSMLKKEGTGHRKNILYRGTCKIRINNKNLLHRILTWIEQLHTK